MAYPKPTLKELVLRIESDLLARVPQGSGILRRSFLRIFARVLGGAINLTYGFIDFLARMLFVTTAAEEYLDEHALKWGKTRRQPTHSKGTATATGVDGTNIPVGTLWQDANGSEYEVQTLVIVAAGVAVMSLKSVETGVDKNIEEGETLTISQPLDGLENEALVDAGGLAGGESLEEDEPLRERVLLRIQTPSTGGNENDYKQWAFDTPGLGVTRVWVFGNFSGPGTVAIFFVLDNQAPIFPNVSQIQQVQNEIDPRTPITALPTVYSPTQKEIGIAMELKPNTTEVQNNVIESLEAWFTDNTDVGQLIFLSQLNEAISLALGEVDHTITALTVDGESVPIDDIPMGANELATIKAADITFV